MAFEDFEPGRGLPPRGGMGYLEQQQRREWLAQQAALGVLDTGLPASSSSARWLPADEVAPPPGRVEAPWGAPAFMPAAAYTAGPVPYAPHATTRSPLEARTVAPFHSAGGSVPVALRAPFGADPIPPAQDALFLATGFDRAWGQPPSSTDGGLLRWNPGRWVYEPDRSSVPPYGSSRRAQFDALAREQSRGVFVQAWRPGGGAWAWRWVEVFSPWPDPARPYRLLGAVGGESDPRLGRVTGPARPAPVQPPPLPDYEGEVPLALDAFREPLFAYPSDERYRPAPREPELSSFAWIPQRDLPVGCPYPHEYMPVPLEDYESGAWLEWGYVPSRALPYPHDQIGWKCWNTPTVPTGRGKGGEPPPPTTDPPPGPIVPPAQREPLDPDISNGRRPAQAAGSLPGPGPVVTPRKMEPGGTAGREGALPGPPPRDEPPPVPPVDPDVKGGGVIGLLGEALRAGGAPEPQPAADDEDPGDASDPAGDFPTYDPDTETGIEEDPAVQRSGKKVDELEQKIDELDRTVGAAEPGSREHKQAEKKLDQAKKDLDKAIEQYKQARRTAAEQHNRQRERDAKRERAELESKKRNAWNESRRDAIDQKIQGLNDEIDRAQWQLAMIAVERLQAVRPGAELPNAGGWPAPAGHGDDPKLRRKLEKLRALQELETRAHAEFRAAPVGSAAEAAAERKYKRAQQEVAKASAAVSAESDRARVRHVRDERRDARDQVRRLQQEKAKLQYERSTTWNPTRRAEMQREIRIVLGELRDAERALAKLDAAATPAGESKAGKAVQAGDAGEGALPGPPVKGEPRPGPAAPAGPALGVGDAEAGADPLPGDVGSMSASELRQEEWRLRQVAGTFSEGETSREQAEEVRVRLQAVLAAQGASGAASRYAQPVTGGSATPWSPSDTIEGPRAIVNFPSPHLFPPPDRGPCDEEAMQRRAAELLAALESANLDAHEAGNVLYYKLQKEAAGKAKRTIPVPVITSWGRGPFGVPFPREIRWVGVPTGVNVERLLELSQAAVDKAQDLVASLVALPLELALNGLMELLECADEEMHDKVVAFLALLGDTIADQMNDLRAWIQARLDALGVVGAIAKLILSIYAIAQNVKLLGSLAKSLKGLARRKRGSKVQVGSGRDGGESTSRAPREGSLPGSPPPKKPPPPRDRDGPPKHEDSPGSGGPEGTGTRSGGLGAKPRPEKWKFGDHHSETQWANDLKSRGWAPGQIDDALARGTPFSAPNKVHPGNTATRYVHPETGRSVVIDDVTGEILHVGGDGFKYD